nr:hypothetical protein [Tanacetum cinerariifolium]
MAAKMTYIFSFSFWRSELHNLAAMVDISSFLRAFEASSHGALWMHLWDDMIWGRHVSWEKESEKDEWKVGAGQWVGPGAGALNATQTTSSIVKGYDEYEGLRKRPSAIPGRAPEELFVPAIIPISVRELLKMGRAPFFPFSSPTFNLIHPPPPDI